MSPSGRGGQPGTYTSTGITRSTPCTTLYERLKRPPDVVQSPMATHHLGSGICSHSRTSGPAIFVVSVPATMSTSACRGLARNGNMLKRSMSLTLVAVGIISIAQQLSPERGGHSEVGRVGGGTEA